MSFTENTEEKLLHELEKITKKLRKKSVGAANISAMKRGSREIPEVLIVEDDEFSAQLVRNSLKGKYKVTIANNGATAISSYTSILPNIMFLDIDLPDITGHEILHKIMDFDPSAFVVMLSGKGDKNNVIKAMQNGAKGFVGKPFARERLLQYIEQSLN